MAEVVLIISTAVGAIQTINQVIKAGRKFMKTITTEDAQLDTIPVHCNLALSFSGLTSTGVTEMDENVKIMIAGTIRSIRNLENTTWKNIIECLNQNSLLQLVPRSSVYNADKIIKVGTNVFDVYGNTDSHIVKEVRSWFTKLINDSDVLADTKIDIDFLAQVVATTGATITSFETLFAKKEYVERRVIDIGILRFPNPDQPFFKLYRIELMAWRDTTRILFIGKDSNGITGIYNCVKYQPRDSVIEKMSEGSKKKAVEETIGLFMDADDSRII